MKHNKNNVGSALGPVSWSKIGTIESAVPAPLLVVSLVKRLKPLTALSGTVYRLASSMSDHMPVV